MDIRKLAADYAALVAEGHMGEAAYRHWADHIVTREPVPGAHAETRGRDEVLAKAQAWADSHEIHGFRSEGPFVNGDMFLILMELDITPKGGERIQFREVVSYRVEQGKVVEERYFY